MASTDQREKPYLEDLYHEIEAGYYDLVFRRGRGAQWYWHEQRFRMVESFLPRNCGRILDLGCGPGTFLGRLPVPFERGLGLDLAVAQVEYAQRVYGRADLTFEATDLRRFVGRETFDTVVSIEVIEHLPREGTQPFLHTILDVLAPGGTVVLTTPNYHSAWPLLERLVSWVGPIDYTRQHINPFTAGRLEGELREAGFCSIESRTFFVVAPFVAALSGSLADRLLRLESSLFRRVGAELVVRAQRPWPRQDA